MKVIMGEVFQSRERRSLTGFEMTLAGQGKEPRLTNLRAASGRRSILPGAIGLPSTLSIRAAPGIAS